MTLPDGDALVLEGSSDLGAPPTVDPGVARYDVETGTWSDRSPIPHPSNGGGLAAVTLPDGRVLVVGGIVSGQDVTLVQLYAPATDSWEQGTPLALHRWNHTATPLDDGTVLVAGGYETGMGGGPFGPTATAARYDPVADSWTPVDPLPVATYLATAAKLPDGDVVVSGGYESDRVFRFDAGTGTWTTLQPLPQVRYRHTAIPTPDGSLLLAGGTVGEFWNPTDGGVDRYDPLDGSVQSLLAGATFPIADAAALSGGLVLLLGRGSPSIPGPRRSVVLDPATGAVIDTGNPPSQQDNGQLVPLGDGSILSIGDLSQSGGSDRFFARTITRTVPADFGEQTSGRRSAVVSVPVTAVSHLLAPLGSATIEGLNASDFTIVTDGCATLLLSRGESCFVGVRFTPSAEGERSATLSVANVLSAGGRIAIPLSGVGLPVPVVPQSPGGGGQQPPQPQPPAGGGGGGTPAPSQRPPARAAARSRAPTTLRIRCSARRGRQVVCTGLPRTLPGGGVRLSRAGIVHATGTLKRGRLTLTVRRRLFDRRYTLVIGHRRPLKLVID
ncbi:kelch repeat-containing protein [Conexibacter stalactiti]|uniref:Kelch repeat-containing protein n=1 Tax=Conexibacter stalactiti TaxID=1940611 RepID=A0ABU4HQ35_9ACTN|nr:kelch repeat-containing protein [Conexibacter stalactiti]MDW5595431.1 kelch repeat-containing protein [Conexibacter stalactiti]MEC5036073.1 kelch repeat-containing protein [Conexibacter stalactiti]